VFSGDTRPCRTLVEACDGADLLVHETFPSAQVFAKKAGVPVDLAEAIVNGAHTSPTMAGKVFARAGARMSAMWHLAVDHESVGPVYSEMRTQARQATLDPVAWPVVGPTTVQGPPESQPHEPPPWWADALITD
jgi:ribonuclease Z